MATKQRELDRVRLEKHVQKGQYEAQISNLVSSSDAHWRHCLTARRPPEDKPPGRATHRLMSGASLHIHVNT